MAGNLRTFLVLALILCNFLPTTIAQGQDEIVTNVTSRYVFGEWLELSARIDTQNLPSKVLLFLQPENQTARQIEVTPSVDGDVFLNYDLSKDSLTPFARIFFWYRLDYPDGNSATTPSYWFDYIDNRYEWNFSTSNLFEVHWVGEDPDYGARIVDLSMSGLEQATQILSVVPDLPIKIYIYPDANSLQDALAITHQPWSAGHASPELGIILVSNGAGSDQLFELERQIPHEIMHILISQASHPNYQDIPAWFTEGLATYTETYPNPELERTLVEALNNSTLIPLSSICLSFPREAEDTLLAYAESLSVIKFMESTYGKSAFPKLIRNAGDGLSCDQLVKISTGLSLEQLETEWLKSLDPSKNTSRVDLILVFGLGAIMLVGIGLGLLIRKRKRANDGTGLNVN